ncbi:MAG: hypothetical protein U1F20_06270 [Lysobacterales bacterium]
MAFDPANSLLFTGQDEWCSTVKLEAEAKVIATKNGASWMGRQASANPLNSRVRRIRIRRAGWLYASDADIGAWAWRAKTNYPIIGGVTPTAGGIVMFGDLGGNFYVLDSATGKVLWNRKIGGGIAGGVITYTPAAPEDRGGGRPVSPIGRPKSPAARSWCWAVSKPAAGRTRDGRNRARWISPSLFHTQVSRQRLSRAFGIGCDANLPAFDTPPGPARRPCRRRWVAAADDLPLLVVVGVFPPAHFDLGHVRMRQAVVVSRPTPGASPDRARRIAPRVAPAGTGPRRSSWMPMEAAPTMMMPKPAWRYCGHRPGPNSTRAGRQSLRRRRHHHPQRPELCDAPAAGRIRISRRCRRQACAMVTPG